MINKKFTEKMLFLFIVPILFIWPAIYNGSPFMFGDSITFLQMGAGIDWVVNRLSYYPFLAISGLVLGSIFFSIFFQAIIMAYLMYVLFVRVNKIHPSVAILLASILAIFTPLAWWVSMLMTEMFLVVVAILFCIIILDIWKDWPLSEKIVTAILLFCTILMHITYPYTILMCVFLVIVVQKIILGRIEKRNWLILGLTTLALFSFPTLNAIKGYGFITSTSQTSQYKYLIARMGGDGIITEDDLRWFLRNEKDNNNIQIRVERLLKLNSQNFELKNNKIKHYITMTARKTSSFHFNADTESPLFSWDENKYISYKDMAIYLLKKHPLENLIAIVKGTYRLWTFPYMTAHMSNKPQYGDVLKSVSPSDYSLYMNSKSTTGNLDILVPTLDPLFSIFYGISLISSVLVIIFSIIKLWKSHSFAFFENNTIALSLLMLTVILIHSTLIYTFGGDYTRYGSRIATAVDVAGLNIIINFFLIRKLQKNT